MFRLPDFHDIRHMNLVRFSASRTGRLYPQECSWCSFSLGAELTPGPWCGRKEICHWKIQCRHLGIDALTTTPPQAPILKLSVPKIIYKNFTDAQDKQPFAVGGRANSFCRMNCVTFASKLCLIYPHCRYNNRKSQPDY